MSKRVEVANWGNYPTVEASVEHFKSVAEAASVVKSAPSVISRGTGLSYGDASLSKNIISTLSFNKILAFDETAGVITTEVGVTLDDVLTAIVPKGWFLPVTPGTKFITVGGAVAGDVHGKNHHTEGAFGKYVVSMEVMLSDGSVAECGPSVNTSLFRMVCGGLGLGALILSVTFRLKKIETSYIRQKNVIVNNLDEMLEKLTEFDSAVFSVSWIDCLARGKKMGRGVLMMGDFAKRDEVKASNPLKVHNNPLITVPFFFPSFTLNHLTVSVFNYLVFHKNKLAKKDFLVHYDTFFYPLDIVKKWNRIYGRAGFVQYQFVIPFEGSRKGLERILTLISDSGTASFLAVLKAMGKGENMISFPIPGFTLAMDFPVSEKVFKLLEKLDQIVIELGGRIYLVKDARMKSEVYWAGYDAAGEFKSAVNDIDPSHKFSSLLSDRLKMI